MNVEIILKEEPLFYLQTNCAFRNVRSKVNIIYCLLLDEIIQKKHGNMRTKVHVLFVVVQITNSFAVHLTIIITIRLVTGVFH